MSVMCRPEHSTCVQLHRPVCRCVLTIKDAEHAHRLTACVLFKLWEAGTGSVSVLQCGLCVQEEQQEQAQHTRGHAHTHQRVMEVLHVRPLPSEQVVACHNLAILPAGSRQSQTHTRVRGRREKAGNTQERASPPQSVCVCALISTPPAQAGRTRVLGCCCFCAGSVVLGS